MHDTIQKRDTIILEDVSQIDADANLIFNGNGKSHPEKVSPFLF